MYIRILVLAITLALALGLIFSDFNLAPHATLVKLQPSPKPVQIINRPAKLSENTHQQLGELSEGLTKINASSDGNNPDCDITSNVLPVRLTISGNNKIKAFGSYISEDFLFKTLEKRSYDCESIKLYFSLEDGVKDDYLKQLIAKIDKLKVTQVYRPAVLHAPGRPVIF